MEYATLGLTDYIIFCLMLVVSSGIGVYFRFSGGKQKTTEEYLLAGKNMGIFPVAFSLMASFKSAISFIGLPAEMYTYGTHFAFYSIGHIVGTFLSAFIFLPVFFDMQVSTAYEYLEKRFGKTSRSLCSFSFTIQMVLYMSVVLYAPALALSAVTNLSIWVSVISIGVVCTFYSTIGGMKAVLWTDVFQGLLMYISLFSVIIKGCIDVGGVSVVFSRTQNAGRLAVPSFKPDLTLRYTMWNVCLQGFLLNLATFGTSQIQVQRLLTLRSLRRSQIAMLVSLPMAVTFHLGSCFAGLVIFANFFDCDPLTSGEGIISKMDQLLPYFVMISLGAIPGLPGLCICGIFSASLSTVSSAVNSLTAVTMEDFIRPFCGSCGITQAKAAFSAKVITLFYGILCMLLAFVIAQFGGVMQAAVTVFGMMAGPVLGTFFLGMFTIRTNEKGAVTGMLLSLALAAWMSFGSSVAGVTHPKLPFSTEGCDFANITESGNPLVSLNGTNFTLPLSTLLTTTVQPESDDTQNSLFPLYQVSFMWLTTVGFLGSIIVGYVTSFFLGERPQVQREYLSPCVRNQFSETRRKQLPIQMEKIGDIRRKSHLSHPIVAFSSELPKEEATVRAVSYNNIKVSKF